MFENAGLEYLQIVDRLRPLIIHTFLARVHVTPLRDWARLRAQPSWSASLIYQSGFAGSPRQHFRLTCCLGRAAMCMRNRSVQ